jgi:hypothetical protein
MIEGKEKKEGAKIFSPKPKSRTFFVAEAAQKELGVLIDKKFKPYLQQIFCRLRLDWSKLPRIRSIFY